MTAQSFQPKEAIKHLDLPSDAWVSLREIRQTSVFRKIRDGRPESYHVAKTHGVMVEVLVDGQFASAATCHLDPSSLRVTAWTAYTRAKALADFGAFNFGLDVRPLAQGKLRPTVVEGFTSMPTDQIIDGLIRIGARMKVGPEITGTDVYLRTDEIESRLVSSHGTDIDQSFCISQLDFSATATRSGETQMRSFNGSMGTTLQAGIEILNLDKLFPEANRVGQQALELLGAEDCPTRKMDLVLMPDQMAMQIHESIGHPLELDRILGDEFNYAGSSFVKPEDFGKLQYGSQLLNVVYDPSVSGELATFAFDDVGAPAKKEYLIEQGILKRALGGLESQKRSGVPGVANSRSIYWNRSPIDRMGNVNISPGQGSLEDLLKGVEFGVLMESNRSWSIDDRREKFQFGCEYGRLIENGKLTRTVKNPNYRGESVPFWRSLKGLGGPEVWQIMGSPYCGKGEPNQLVRVGHASPPALFSQVEVFGGGK